MACLCLSCPLEHTATHTTTNLLTPPTPRTRYCQVIENAVRAVKHLRSMGCNDIEFSPEDAGECRF